MTKNAATKLDYMHVQVAILWYNKILVAYFVGSNQTTETNYWIEITVAM